MVTGKGLLLHLYRLGSFTESEATNQAITNVHRVEHRTRHVIPEDKQKSELSVVFTVLSQKNAESSG